MTDSLTEPNSPLTLVPARPDHVVAAELRQRISESARPLLEMLDAAKAAGFIVNLNFSQSPLGMWQLPPHAVGLSKQF